ncbi:hypothetical protein P0Y35_11460 [Kiritimatiellaeota bacterium B1221]|nr:hypothetical protein [Kiritimatiellaeota bacterium B1221]
MKTQNFNRKTIEENLALLQNEQKLIREETVELQKYIVDGVNPGYLLVSNSMEALLRIRELCNEHATLTRQIRILLAQKNMLDLMQASPMMARC